MLSIWYTYILTSGLRCQRNRAIFVVHKKNRIHTTYLVQLTSRSYCSEVITVDTSRWPMSSKSHILHFWCHAYCYILSCIKISDMKDNRINIDLPNRLRPGVFTVWNVISIENVNITHSNWQSSVQGDASDNNFQPMSKTVAIFNG